MTVKLLRDGVIIGEVDGLEVPAGIDDPGAWLNAAILAQATAPVESETIATDHIADATAAHAATAIAFTPNGSIAATNVQAAIQEVRDEAGGSIVSASANLTADVTVSTSVTDVLSLALAAGTWLVSGILVAKCSANAPQHLYFYLTDDVDSIKRTGLLIFTSSNYWNSVAFSALVVLASSGGVKIRAQGEAAGFAAKGTTALTDPATGLVALKIA